MLKKIMLCLGLLGIAAQASSPAGPEHQAVDVKNMSLEEIKDLSSTGYVFDFGDVLDFARSGNLDGVKFVAEFAKNDDVKCYDAGGYEMPRSNVLQNMFVEAVQNGQTEVFDYLLQQDENLINAKNAWARTALNAAVLSKNEALKDRLVKKAAETCDSNFFFEAIHLEQIDALRYLLDQNPDMVRHKLGFAVSTENLELVQLFVERGAKISVYDFNKAISLENFKIVDYLLAEDQDLINSKDDYENTPLSMAVRSTGKLKVVQSLVEKYNAEIDVRALCEAIRCKHFEIVNYLLDKKQNIINSEDSWWIGTPLAVAVRTEKKDLVELLIKRGALVDPNALFEAVKHAPISFSDEYRSVEIVKLLLEQAPDLISATDAEGKTLVEVAKQYGKNEKVVEFLENFNKN